MTFRSRETETDVLSQIISCSIALSLIETVGLTSNVLGHLLEARTREKKRAWYEVEVILSACAMLDVKVRVGVIYLSSLHRTVVNRSATVDPGSRRIGFSSAIQVS